MKTIYDMLRILISYFQLIFVIYDKRSRCKPSINSKFNIFVLYYVGDDPRDVKARLKVWAQAVAIASATKYGS